MPKVKIYTTPTCAFCHATKEFLNEHNVKFEEIDVASDAASRDEMVQKSGQLGVPVTDIDGKIIVGFNRKQLQEVLGLNE